ncbi:MAG: 16S rRNA (guanine(527)-N(7))-methyltransferase RsmG [Ostreibacterium sp.]
MQNHLSQLLSQASKSLGIILSLEQQEQLIRYTLELEKWNHTYNLTAVRDAEKIMKRHIIDTLSMVKILKQLSPKTLADIGTGGGIPGVILAIVLPNLQVALLENIGKKCRFLRHVTHLLALTERVIIYQQRVENWQPEYPVSVIICRAFTSLENFMAITYHLGNHDSYWLAMKSAHTATEERNLPNDVIIEHNIALEVPFETAERHLLILKKQLTSKNRVLP